MLTAIYVIAFGLMMSAPFFPGEWIPVFGMFILLFGFIWHTLDDHSKDPRP